MDSLTREQVEADGSVLIQALTHDFQALKNAYEQCKINEAALEAGRQHIIKEAERLRRQIEERNSGVMPME